jgi:hypothetical protein
LNGVGSEGEAAVEFSAALSDTFGFVLPVASATWPEDDRPLLPNTEQSGGSRAGTIVRLDASNVPVALVCQTEAGDSVSSDTDLLDELLELLADDCLESGDVDADWALVELFGQD